MRIAASPASWHDGGGGTGAVIRDSCGPADVDVVAGAASAPPARVVAVDDHDLARAALRTVIAQDARMQLVGEARNGREAVNLVRQLQPDLVLMDVRMPDMDGLQATRLVKQDCPMTCVLILTMMDDVDLLLETVKAGAAGFVLKSASEAELRTAIYQLIRVLRARLSSGSRMSSRSANIPPPPLAYFHRVRWRSCHWSHVD